MINNIYSTDTAFRNVAKELRCPTCSGLSVLDSDAEFSTTMKNIIKQKISNGLGKDAILKYFKERYGTWILRSPPKEGLGLVAWITPILIVSTMILFLLYLLTRERKHVRVMTPCSREEALTDMNNRLKCL